MNATAIAVIDLDLARSRRGRYELNMMELARRCDLGLAAWIRFTGTVARPGMRILEARDRCAAVVVVVPSLRHLRGQHDWVRTWADIYAVGRGRVYRQRKES